MRRRSETNLVQVEAVPPKHGSLPAMHHLHVLDPQVAPVHRDDMHAKKLFWGFVISPELEVPGQKPDLRSDIHGLS